MRDRVVRRYEEYVRSFQTILDPEIRRTIDQELDSGLLWPKPYVSLNPALEPGGPVDELVDQGLLHEDCRRTFRRKQGPEDTGRPLLLHRLQVEAIREARAGRNYVVTTGTASGKSLTYIVPIVDHVLRQGASGRIQAVVVYPMNALANSQQAELKKFLERGFPGSQSPVRFARFTGQEAWRSWTGTSRSSQEPDAGKQYKYC